MSSSVGVIIQGPLLTYGQGTNSAIQGFDTCDIILRNIRSLHKLQLSPWSGAGSENQ